LIENISMLDIITLVFISTFSLIRNYLIVEFRINLNYKKIFIENMLMSLGYLLGLGMFYLFGFWHLIYITGYFFSFIYLLKTTNLLKENYKLTKFFKPTFNVTRTLFISGLLMTSFQYTDKLIILPIMGSRVVSVYYSAAIIGKMIMMVIVPFSSVILSYLIRFDEISKDLFNKITIFILIVSIPIYFLMFYASMPILNFLYPHWSIESIEIVPYILVGVVFQILTALLNPIVLIFKDISWQIKINLVTFLVYISISILLYYVYGLIGFCIGISFSHIIRFIYIVYIYNYKK
jgi:O-antigen/teichoic acid export membrane protein